MTIITVQSCLIKEKETGDGSLSPFLNAHYTWQDVLETLALIPFVALLAPIVEEFGMRVYSITPFETKTGRIVAAIMTSLLFSFMHVSRWKIVFAAGMVYTMILLI